MGTAQAIATETVYVLKNTNRQYLEYPTTEFMEACGFAVPFGAIDGSRSDLYSIQTQSAHGRVVNDHVKKVGELISCILWPTVDSDPPHLFPFYPGLAENYLDPTPSQNLNVLYSISLNGEQYFAGGSARARTQASWELPYPGSFLSGATATVSKPMGAGLVVVGSFTNNVAIEVVPGASDPQKPGGIIVLRISQPGFSVTPN
jgi:hypothetical protein